MNRQESARRVALVTGAARGIGAATAIRLARSGYVVLAMDACGSRDYRPIGHTVPPPTPEDLFRVAAEAGSHCEPHVVDVANAAAVRSAVDAAVAAHGRLDVVVCAAAVIDGGAPVWETPDKVLRELMDVDVHGVWNTAVAALPHLIAGPSPHEARFIAIASAAGHRGLFHLTAYAMAKHAVVGLVRGLQADLVATGVVAIAVSPGSTDTAMLEATGQLYGLDPADFAGHHSIRRLLSVDDLAATVEFCCSPAAAALAGSVVHADGGFA